MTVILRTLMMRRLAKMLVKLLEEVEGLAKVDRTSISAPTLNGHSYNWSPEQPLHIHPLHILRFKYKHTDFQAVIFGSERTVAGVELRRNVCQLRPPAVDTVSLQLYRARASLFIHLIEKQWLEIGQVT